MRGSRTLERVILGVLVLLAGWQQVRLGRQERAMAALVAHAEELAAAQRELAEAARQRAIAPLRAPLPGELYSAARPKAAPSRGEPAGRDERDDPPAFDGPVEPRPGARRFAQQRAAIARVEQRLPQNPGAVVLDRLYEAADEMAVREQWDDQTYDEVAEVFETTTGGILDLWADLKEGEVAPIEARDEALALRDQAHERLAGILGEDGLEVLRQHVKATAPEPP